MDRDSDQEEPCALAAARQSDSFGIQTREMLYQLLPGALRVREPVLSAHVVGTFDDLFQFLGDGERVARLSATWEKICVAFGWGGGTSYPEPELRRLETLRAAIGEESWSRGREEGHSWSLQEALTYIAKTAPD